MLSGLPPANPLSPGLAVRKSMGFACPGRRLKIYYQDFFCDLAFFFSVIRDFIGMRQFDFNHYTVVNLGNTNTVAAWVESGQLLDDRVVMATSNLLEGSIDNSPLAPFLRGSCLLSCVVPSLRAKIAELFPGVEFLTTAMVPPTLLDFSRVDGRTVGADRIANALAALDFSPPPLLVVDCGTAVTIEVVDRNRAFRGGAIWPGRALQRTVLHSHTGQLPELELESAVPSFPAPDTRAAMRAGIDLGIVGAIIGLRQSLQDKAECRGGRTLLTGGDGPFFATLIPEAELMDQTFTLQGLLALARELSTA